MATPLDTHAQSLPDSLHHAQSQSLARATTAGLLLAGVGAVVAVGVLWHRHRRRKQRQQQERARLHSISTLSLFPKPRLRKPRLRYSSVVARQGSEMTTAVAAEPL